MDKRHSVKNIRSNQVIEGSPKLPTAEQIEHGEIAINFAQGHETLSLKNDANEIVPFELRSVSNLDNKLNSEIERAQSSEQENAEAIEIEEERAKAKENEISNLLGTKSDTKDNDTAFGRIEKEVNDRANAINSLDATVGSTTVETGKHIAVQVVEADGKLESLTVTENDIASAAALANEITRATEEEESISNLLGTKSDTKYSETAFGYIAKEADARATAIATAINALDKTETTASEDNAHVTVKYSETNGIVSMNVTESDIASAQGLVNEITRATNSENEIKETYLKNINVNGINGVFSDNVASLTVKGKDIDVADNYTPVEYPIEFEDKTKSYHIVNTDKIDSAFNKVENTFKVLSEEVITNELTNSNAINNLADATGVIASDDSISYVQYQKAHYINDALSVHHATMLLDDALADVSNSIKDLGNVDDVKVNGNSVVSSNKVANIVINATSIPLTDGQGETSTIFSELTSIKESVSGGANSLETKINALTNKIIEDELVTANSISALADSAGLVTIGNEIKYVKKAKPYYIAEAETLADAINLLDDRIKLIEGLIDTKIKKAIYDLIKANPTLVNPYDSNTSNA